MLTEAQIEFRHGHHAPPPGSGVGQAHAEIREIFIEAAKDAQEVLAVLLPPPPPAEGSRLDGEPNLREMDARRALALMHTHLEQARQWANAAVAYAGACGELPGGTQPAPAEGPELPFPAEQS